MNIIRHRKKPTLGLHDILPANIHKNNVVFVCIGSDLTIGDSLGPLVGSKLERMGYYVIGTLDTPLHGLNIKQRLTKEIENTRNKLVIAIDACLGGKNEVGKFEVRKGPIQPGAGIGKNLIKVGDFSISAVVSSAGPFEFLNTKNIRLSLVINMADQIAAEIDEYFTLSKKEPAQN